MGHAELAQPGHVLFGDDPTHEQAHVAYSSLAQCVLYPRHQRHVSPTQKAQAQPAGILVGHRPRDGFGRLPEAGVDHVKARIAQAPGDNLDAPIVAVKAHFGKDDSRLGAILAIGGLENVLRDLGLVAAENFFQGVHDLADAGAGMGGLEQWGDQVLLCSGGAAHRGEAAVDLARIGPGPAVASAASWSFST